MKSANPTPDELQAAAAGWLATSPGAIAPDQLRDQLDRIGAHLVSVFGVDYPVASNAVLKAWAALEAERSHARFDLEDSTPYLVFIVDPVSGQRRAISSTDLLRMMGPRRVAAA